MVIFANARPVLGVALRALLAAAAIHIAWRALACHLECARPIAVDEIVLQPIGVGGRVRVVMMLLLAAVVLAVLVAIGVVCSPARYGRQVLDDM